MRRRRLLYQALVVVVMAVVSAARAPQAAAAAMMCETGRCVSDCGSVWLELDCGSCGTPAYPSCGYSFQHDCTWAECTAET